MTKRNTPPEQDSHAGTASRGRPPCPPPAALTFYLAVPSATADCTSRLTCERARRGPSARHGGAGGCPPGKKPTERSADPRGGPRGPERTTWGCGGRPP